MCGAYVVSEHWLECDIQKGNESLSYFKLSFEVHQRYLLVEMIFVQIVAKSFVATVVSCMFSNIRKP